MRIALLLPFSPSDPANSGAARLEMFDGFSKDSLDRYHFGPATGNDISIGQYAPEGSPRNLSSLVKLWQAFGRRHRQQPYQAIWTTMPPIMMALFARLLAARYRLPLIVDVRDPGIASVVMVRPQGSPMYRVAFMLERWLYRGAAAICVTTPELAAMLTRRFGVKPERLTVISNATAVKERPAKKLDPNEVRVFYAGTFAPYQAIDQLVDNLSATPPGPQFHFDFYGYRKEQNPGLENRVTGNVALHPRLPRQELFEKLKASDIVLVPIELKGQKELYEYAVPLKLYEAIGFSRPVVLFGGTAASKRLVQETGAGEVCPVEQPLAPVLGKIVNDYAAYRRAAEQAVFSRQEEGAKLRALMESLTK